MKRGKTYLKIAWPLVILLIMIFLFFNQGLIGATIFEEQPDSIEGKDTYITETSDDNYGDDVEIKIGNIGGYERRGLIEFNLSSIDNTDTVVNAYLQVYVETVEGSLDKRNLTIHRITKQWNETEVGWNNATSTETWDSPGGDYGEEIETITITNETGVYYNFTITSAVRKWVNNTYDNFGLIISSEGEKGNYIYLSSSDSDSSNQHPKIIVDHTSNSAPSIQSISTNSEPTNPLEIGEEAIFSINWTDLEGDNAQVYVCNSTNISFDYGCGDRLLCNTSLSSTNPAQCSYTVSESDNRTTKFWTKVCDDGKCSEINSSQFYMNHNPSVSIIQPNGGETVNQSEGNYNIQFNVSDLDNDYLYADLYYGTSPNSTDNLIVSDLNLSNVCTDEDSSTTTTNNCTYSWNSTDIYGTFYLTANINDTFSTTNDTSDSSFIVRSLIDSNPPNITDYWIENTTIYSGRPTKIYANVSDASLENVWFEINHSSINNVTMSNTSLEQFEGTFTAPSVGKYEFKVYANDTPGNINDTLAWKQFNVTKPTASPKNEIYPNYALPSSSIGITADLSATDSLKDVNVTLNTPSGFEFPFSSHPQTQEIGNFSEGDKQVAKWFIFLPNNETTHTFNVTWTDKYNNSWQGDNKQIVVTYDSTNLTNTTNVNTIAFSELEAGDVLESEIQVRDINGKFVNASSVEISLYDSNNNLVIGPVNYKSQLETGRYFYNYTTPSTPTGHWTIYTNVTRNKNSFIDREHFRLTGGPFDVRGIEILDNTAPNLEISTILENMGDGVTDIAVDWNLTRTDTGEVLDTGQDTIGVSEEETHTINPETTYTGEAKITFLGTWSSTEKAGAYETFTIIEDKDTKKGVGGGGGGGASTPQPTTNKTNISVSYEDEITLSKNLKKIVDFSVKNTGSEKLTNLTLELDGLLKDEYTLKPLSIKSLKPNDEANFEIEFLITNFIGEKEFTYIFKSNEIEKTLDGKLEVLNLLDFYEHEIERLKKLINKTKNSTQGQDNLEDLAYCEEIISNVQSNIEDEKFIDAKNNLAEAESCIKNIKTDLEDEKGFSINLPSLKMPSLESIIPVFFVILGISFFIILIFFLYKIYRKISILTFFKKQEELIKPTPISEIDQDNFDERMKKIEKKLGVSSEVSQEKPKKKNKKSKKSNKTEEDLDEEDEELQE